MTKEELIEFLKENLKVSIYYDNQAYCSYEAVVKLELDGEVISESRDYVPSLSALARTANY